MAPADEFALQGNHHSVKVCLGGEVKTYLDPEVQGGVVRKRLVSDQTTSGKGETFHSMFGVRHHVAQHIGGEYKEVGAKGHPCLTDLASWKSGPATPLTLMAEEVDCFGDESYQALVDVCRGCLGVEHGCEGLEQGWGNLIRVFMEELHWNIVMPGHLTFGQGFDGVQDVLNHEGPSEVSVGVMCDLHWHTGPAFRLGLHCAEGVRI
ncbi:unnamed protein product [Sphagnum balticum]